MRTKLSLLIAALLCALPHARATVYVRSDAPGPVHDGASWPTAFQALQDGISAAGSGEEVWVAAGVYAGPITLMPGVSLMGGFTGVETFYHQRNWTLHPTVIDGGGAALAVVLPSVAPGAPRARIDGFTIRNGVVGLGTPGPYLGSVVAYASHDHITANLADGVSIAGAGLDFQIEDSVVDHNGGNGIVIDGFAPKINMNTVLYNGGTGVACYWSGLVAGNIVAYNGSAITLQGNPAGTARHNFSWRNSAGDFGAALPGDVNGNVIADPDFADLLRGDYHLQRSSPCVDAGDDAAFSAGEEDMAGLPRILGAHADAGAFESDGTVWARDPYILHVKPGGLDLNDGLSWAAAKRKIQTAVECANQPNDEVWVASGTYNETVLEAFGTRLLGGFAGSETSGDARDPSVNVTTIDAGGLGAAVRVAKIFDGVTLDGFHLLHGTPAGFSVDWINGNTTLTRCTVEDSDAGAIIANNATVTSNTITGNRGNGISLLGGLSNVISGNTVSLNTGHGISDGTSSLIYSNTIENNGGWGVYNLGFSALSGCVIRGNAGGIFAEPEGSSGQATSVTGCVVSYNRGDGISAGFEAGATMTLNTLVGNGGAGISSDYMSPVYGNLICANHDGVLMNDLSDVVGNTIAGNTDFGLRIVDTANSGVVANNVVAFNSQGVRVIPPTSFIPLDFRHNDVYGNTSVNLDLGPVIDITDGNKSAEPLFVNFGSGDYHLSNGSPCIDAGDDLVRATGTDLDGKPRKQGAHIDIGAYESPPPPTGEVAAWGNNQYGEVAAGAPNPSRSPVAVAGLTDVRAVSAGDYHSLALRSDGTVWAWGQGGYGQLGNGHWDNHDTPVKVANLSGVIAISARSLHSLALKSDGTVWAWGFNDNGQLGIGTYTSRNAPVQVPGVTDAIAISAGRLFSLALMSNGTVLAWGFNGSGQLGNGATNQSPLPVAVSNLTSVVRISAGGNHSAAVLRDGTVWCWGDNALGQLGNGTLTASPVPVQATGISNASEVAAGSAHNLALLSNGHLVAWGYNSQGQLGTGTHVNSSIAVSVNSIAGVASVCAGEIHSAAVTADGYVWTWGSNWIGQLGTGGTADVLAPGKLTGLAGVSSVSAGWMHTLAVFSTTSRPYDVADAARALRIAGGLVTSNGSDTSRLDIVAPSGVNALDALKIARKAAGLDTNP